MLVRVFRDKTYYSFQYLLALAIITLESALPVHDISSQPDFRDSQG